MMTTTKLVALLCCVCWVTFGSPLHKGPDPVKEGTKSVARSRTPRQVSYLPFLGLPSVFQVHQIVLVQPDTRCPVTPAPDGGDVSNRFGDEDAKPEEPSRCVWSIVACCSPGSRNIRYTCFELLGCPGAFWDVNPCDEKVVTAAANTALRFYEQNTTDTSAAKGRNK